MNKKITLTFILFFIVNPVFAQGIGIKLNFIGYGKTVEEVYFTVHNSGEFTVTNVSFYVDNKLYMTIDAVLSSKSGFQTTLHLNPGEHLIEVKTPEGAYDSLKISIPKITERLTTSTVREDTLFLPERNNILVIVGAVLIIFVIITWLLIRKPKLEQE